MAGRALRLHADVPIKQVVQCAATRHPFPRTAPPAEQYLWTGDGWRSLTVNRQIEAMTQRMQSVVAASRSELPPMLAPKPGRERRRRFGWRNDLVEAT
jgi:hypothetical protein